MAGRHRNRPCRTRQGPYPYRPDPARRREVERVVADQHGRTLDIKRQLPGDVRPRRPVPVHHPEHQPGRIHPVTVDLIVISRQPQNVRRRVGRKRPGRDQLRPQVSVDPQLGQHRPVDPAEVDERRRIRQRPVVPAVWRDRGEVRPADVHLQPLQVGADHRARQARHRRGGAEVPVERGRDDRLGQRVDLRLVDRGPRLGHPEQVHHAGVLHAPVHVAAGAGRVVDPGPGQHAAVPVVSGGDGVHACVRGRLPLLDGLGVGAAVEAGRTGQRADRLGNQVGPPDPVHRRLQRRLLNAVRALDRGVVVLGKDVLLVVRGQAHSGHRPGRRPRVI
jgi:hypothetical protein